MNKSSENTLFDTNIGNNKVVLGKTGAGKTFLMSEFILLMTKVKGEEDGKSSCRVDKQGGDDGN